MSPVCAVFMAICNKKISGKPQRNTFQANDREPFDVILMRLFIDLRCVRWSDTIFSHAQFQTEKLCVRNENYKSLEAHICTFAR